MSPTYWLDNRAALEYKKAFADNQSELHPELSLSASRLKESPGHQYDPISFAGCRAGRLFEPGDVMHIETGRLHIRSITDSDAHALATIWSDPEVARYMGGPRDFAQVLAIFEEDARAGAQDDIDLWPVVEKASGRVVGHCGLIHKEVDDRPEIELVYVLATSAWGRGYATEAASAVRDYALHRIGLRRVVALIDPENTASERVAEKVGMRFERETRRPGGKVLRVYAIEADEAENYEQKQNR